MDDKIFDQIQQVDLKKTMETSYIDYAMSVIASRALPDVRDGLKPVQRRILFSMNEMNNTYDKPHKKCARIVGDTMGKYHPHGDSSIYGALVNMAQPWSMRYTLVDGHGNFGSVDGDGAAAMRYTEARLSKISSHMIEDLGKNTVKFMPNYDETEKEPEVLPARFPNLLDNGTTGIAVGMATNIPPHNLSEVIDGCVAYIDNPEIDTLGLMGHVKGPDFPTGGIILGNKGIRQAYETGRGSVTIRSRARIEEKNGRNYIVVDEVPYGVNTQELKNKVAELVHNKVLEGISDYHTDLKEGVKITITLKKDANPQVVLNNLYKHTSFQTNFGIIFLMLDNGVPKTLGLKDIISKYIDYQKEIIIRRTNHDLANAEKRVHILEGYKIALDNIDEVIKIIKEAASDVVAKEKLINRFDFTQVQADNILELKLRRLTGLERNKIESELKELLKLIAELKEILSSDANVLAVVRKELLEVKNKYGDERRTSIDMTAIDFIEDESLIPEEDIVVALTHKGYIKRMPTDTYKLQNKGGVGIKGMSTNDEDFVEILKSGTTHNHVLFFTNKGKVYRIKGYEIPEFSRQSKGLPIINLLPIEKDEKVNNILLDDNNEENKYLVISTKKGLIKRTNVCEFENIRKSGKIAITLREDDEVLSVYFTNGNDDIVIASSNGRMIRFNENEIRVMGRTASGVKGIELSEDCICVGSEIAKNDQDVLVVTEKGYGKRTDINEYRLTHRGSKGVKTLNITDKNGTIVAFKTVTSDKDLMLITDQGIVIRISLDNVSKMSRVTQGVRLMNLREGQKVATVSVVDKVIEEETQNNEEKNDSVE